MDPTAMMAAAMQQMQQMHYAAAAAAGMTTEAGAGLEAALSAGKECNHTAKSSSLIKPFLRWRNTGWPQGGDQDQELHPVPSQSKRPTTHHKGATTRLPDCFCGWTPREHNRGGDPRDFRVVRRDHHTAHVKEELLPHSLPPGGGYRQSHLPIGL